MAKKTASASKTNGAAAKKPAAVVAASTPVRNSAVPPKAAVVTKKLPTYDEVALTAYYIWKSNGGSQEDNWYRALREMGQI